MSAAAQGLPDEGKLVARELSKSFIGGAKHISIAEGPQMKER
jgi:hypothetical protein